MKLAREIMLKRLPSTKEMQAFIVTAQQLTFTSAAQVLNLTQGAVSRQILSLEGKLDTRLFHRHARGLSLTEQGEAFLPLIKTAINDIQYAVEKVSNIKPVIRLKIPSCIASWLLPKIMTFQKAFPQISVQLTSAIQHDISFSSESFDAAICYVTQVEDDHLTSQLLFKEVLTPMCSANLLLDDELPMSFEKMQALPWLHSTPQQSDWALWLSKADRSTLTSNHHQHFATLDLAVSAAKQGFGISIGDITLASTDIASGSLKTPHPLQVESGKAYYFIYPKTATNPALKTFLDWLIAV